MPRRKAHSPVPYHRGRGKSTDEKEEKKKREKVSPLGGLEKEKGRRGEVRVRGGMMNNTIIQEGGGDSRSSHLEPAKKREKKRKAAKTSGGGKEFSVDRQEEKIPVCF